MDPGASEIADDCWLLRWVHPDFMDTSQPDWRPTSQAFQDIVMDGQKAMSVYLECVLLDRALDASCVLSGLPGYGLVALRAGDIRAEGLTIELRPNLSDLPRGHAHAHVVGEKTRPLRRKLATICLTRP